jgi:predicted dehydrogenase
VKFLYFYSRAVQKIKEVIRENGEPRAFNARYTCAYSTIAKEMWWNIDQSGGPIVCESSWKILIVYRLNKQLIFVI